ncbi:FAD-dependent monooxygenase [uncultured Nocardioides sp.]|uniref:FAD-dependent monooxygenase n=1 Tax=uncultured Nocardioides sp. TaxID=198441 RepID=UPI002611532E|nr:FAD-dependent monooxygenase [uncultured Nocardioides sp.]
MRVVVVGAGIGGLALAQGLVGEGVDVLVLERDRALPDTGGYRLHLTPAAGSALRGLLGAEAWRSVVAACAPPGASRRMHVTDRRLRTLVTAPFEPGPDDEPHRMVGRIPLRVALGTGLADRLRLGVRVTGTAPRTAGGVDVLLADADPVAADVVVAADGVGSVVARGCAGGPTSAPVGLQGLAGRAEPGPGVPELLGAGPVLGIGPHGVGAFLTLHAPADEVPEAIWGLVVSDGAAARADLGDADPRAAAARLLRGWDPWLRDLVAHTDPATVGRYRFHAADPRRGTAPWRVDPAAPVVALGDAVHAMPPTGGQSASTAVLDAADLRDALVRSAPDAATLAARLDEVGDTIARRGAAAVAESVAPARWIRRTEGPVGSAALLGAERAVSSARGLLGALGVRRGPR